MMLKRKEKESFEDEFFSDFNRLEEIGEKKEKRMERYVKVSFNKLKIAVSLIEIVLIIYFILAMLGFVPFF